MQSKPQISTHAQEEPATVFRRTLLKSQVLVDLGIPFAIVVLCLYFALNQPRFLTVSNFQNVTRQITVLGILGIGETMTLVVGGMDLSVGSVVGLAGIVAALLSVPLGVAPAVLIGILSGGVVGTINGLAIARLRVPPFIATLGMLSIARGATYVLSDGRAITNVPPGYGYLAESFVGPVPMPVLVLIILIIIFQILLAWTTFGRRVYAVGINPVAARLSGVKITRIQFFVYTLSGLLAGIGGVVLSARTASGQPTAGMGFELQVIAAVVLGGVSLFGGRGSLWRAMVGVLFIGLLANGLNLLNVSPYTQMVVIGLALIAALAIDQTMKGMQRDPWR